MSQRQDPNSDTQSQAVDPRARHDRPLAACFELFIDEAKRQDAPFYARLSAIVCQDAELLELATHAQSTPVPNLLFSAVRYLLLRGEKHELANYFACCHETPRQNEGLSSIFKEFCRRHTSEIENLLRTRRVQTNEVNRCSVLLPAFATVFEQAGRRPLALIDVGTSAGLNLLWDRFSYSYGAGPTVGMPDSPLHLQCQMRGAAVPPMPALLPPVASRIGLDLQPVDLRDADQRQWLEALVWPDHPHRLRRLKQATQIALTDDHDLVLIQGDAREMLPSIIAAGPPDATCCIFHSASYNQLPPDAIADIDEQLLAASARRDVFRIAAEAEQLIVHTYRGGTTHTERMLASFDSHGRWLEWKPD